MSDNLKYILIVTEGSHDVEAITRVLKLRGYKEQNYKNKIPDILQTFIPKQYPFDPDGYMKRGVPRPSFLCQEDKYIIIINAGGIDKIGEQLGRILSVTYESVLQMLNGIAIIADMDNMELADRQEEIIYQLKSEIDDMEIKVLETGDVTIQGEKEYPLWFFFFPDNDSKGTLESLLLDGAKHSYPDLLDGAHNYISKAKEKYPLQNFDDLKAIVGTIANVLRPGRANQVSIHDNEWITTHSLSFLETHRRFAAFLDLVIGVL